MKPSLTRRPADLSEDPGPHDVFLFLGAMGWGDGISRMVVVVKARILYIRLES